MIAFKLDLDEYKNVFDIYRGKLKAFPKLLNNLHLNILANLSEIVNNNEKAKGDEEIIKFIMLDIKAFYRKSSKNDKRKEFKKKIIYEIDIHEVITKVGVNITKSSRNVYSLLDSYFFEDILDYLLIIVNESNNIVEVINKIKLKKTTDIAKVLHKIIDNSINIVMNVFSYCDETISDVFIKIVILK